jgi:hypothetical protein
MAQRVPNVAVERGQSGVRLEKRMLKVLKALAEYLDVSLAEVIELIVLQAFEGQPAFSKGTLRRISELRRIYDMQYGVEHLRVRLFMSRSPRGVRNSKLPTR